MHVTAIVVRKPTRQTKARLSYFNTCHKMGFLNLWRSIHLFIFCVFTTTNFHKDKFPERQFSCFKVQLIWKKLILKFLFGVIKLFQKIKENKSTWGIIVVKLIFFHFWEELRIPKSHFETNWPLVAWKFYVILCLERTATLTRCQILFILGKLLPYSEAIRWR